MRVVLPFAAFALLHSLTVSEGYERRMVRLHGSAYEEYRRRVPRFLPRLRRGGT